MGDTLRTFLISMLVSGIVLFAFGEYMLRRVEGFDPLQTFGNHDESVAAAAPVQPEREAWETIPAPKLVGLDLARAEAQWKELGILVRQRGETESSDVAPGTIVSQNPAPGEKLQNPELGVWLAVAPTVPTMPDMRGQSLDDVREKLGALPQSRTIVEMQLDRDEAHDGKIIAQQPQAGSELNDETNIRLTIATLGTRVPDFRGHRIPEIESRLRQLHLRVGDLETREHTELAGGRILDQEPRPGTRVLPESRIDFLIVAPD